MNSQRNPRYCLQGFPAELTQAVIGQKNVPKINRGQPLVAPEFLEIVPLWP